MLEITDHKVPYIIIQYSKYCELETFHSSQELCKCNLLWKETIKSTHVQGRCSHLFPRSLLRPLKKRLLWEAVARLLRGSLNSPEPSPVPLPAT